MDQSSLKGKYDVIRFEIVEEDLGSLGPDKCLEVYINDVEMTSKAAGLGMNPRELLVPENRLMPDNTTGGIQRFPIACCECGVYGCGATDVELTEDKGRIVWHWSGQIPATDSHTFSAEQYKEAVKRIEKRYFELESDTEKATRLIYAGYSSIAHLKNLGIDFDWASDKYNEQGVFEVCMSYRGNFRGEGWLWYQVFVSFPWENHTAEQMAAIVLETLATDPETWRASWSRISRDNYEIPKIVGPKWVRRPDW